MRKPGFAFLAALSLVFLSTISVRADLLNGGFETMGTLMVNGVTDAPSWTVTDSSQATGIYNGNYLGLGAHSGNSFLWGGAYGSVTGSISQAVTTTAGQTYDLEFWLANSNGYSSADNNWAVMWNGTYLASTENAADFSYMDMKFLVTGTGNDMLTFLFRNEPGAFGLDDVSLKAAAVPISPSIVLFASGMGGLLLFRRKRYAF